MSVADVLKKLRTGKSSVAEITAALAEIDVDALEAASEALEAERRRVLLDGSDKDLEAIEAKITAADREVERAVAAKAELERRLEQATAAQSEGERIARYKAAKAKSKQAADRVVKEYAAHAKGLADLIRALAEATVAVQAANADLPAGAEPLADPEFSARGLPGLPRKVIAETEVVVWYHVSRDMIVPEIQWPKLDKIDRDSGRTGILHLASGNDVWPGRYEKRKFIRREFVDPEPMVRPEPLSTIKLPGLIAGDPSFWSDWRTSDARSIVAKFEMLAQQKPARREDQRQVKIEFVPVEQAADEADQEQAA